LLKIKRNGSCVKDCSGNPFFLLKLSEREKDWNGKPDPKRNGHVCLFGVLKSIPKKMIPNVLANMHGRLTYFF
jgi:hypothetical protein